MDQKAHTHTHTHTKTQDRKSNRTRQKNKRGDSKVESNGSSEIPDRGETSDFPDLLSGTKHGEVNTWQHIMSSKKKKSTVNKKIRRCQITVKSVHGSI